MTKPRIIIADTDEKYIIPLQLKFVEEYFDKVDIEIITDERYFEELFSMPQKIDILVVCENLYSVNLQRHNVNHTFVMMEQYREEQTADLNVTRLFKYTSIKEIYSEIVGNSYDVLETNLGREKGCQILLVYSACGGVGKTTISLGMSLCLTKSYKRVLYINAGRLQTFQREFKNQSAIVASDIYSKLVTAEDSIYSEIKHAIRKEGFSYLPPFKASLMSLGLPYSIYETIAQSAKASKDYDYIVIDADTTFDEDKAKLLSIADKVIIVTKQNSMAVYATNVLASNINGIDSEKYIFMCNDFDKERDNALISGENTMRFTVDDYVFHIEHYDHITCEDLSKESGIQKTSFLVM